MVTAGFRARNRRGRDAEKECYTCWGPNPGPSPIWGAALPIELHVCQGLSLLNAYINPNVEYALVSPTAVDIATEQLKYCQTPATH